MKSRIIALASAALIAATSIFPVFAAPAAYTAINGSNLTMDKYLIMDKDANVPNATASFTITPGTAIPATANTLEVKAGPAGATIGSATFTPKDATYTTAQQTDATINGSATNKLDSVTLTANQKYAKSPVTITMTGVSFNEPGVYRWKVTESTSTNAAIANDLIADRYLDVYVEDNNGTLRIMGAVLHNEAGAPSSGATPANPTADQKDGGYRNTLTTHNLTLAKEITGNQASKDEYFEFTVAITGAGNGTKLEVNLDDADATTATNGINTTAHTNPALITCEADGSATQTFWLQGTQSIVIKGLPDGAKYTINENATTMANEGYATSIASEGDTDISKDNAAFRAADSSTGIKADSTVTYTNQKSGVVPTGLVSTFAPYLIGLVLAAGAAGFVVMKKKNQKAA